MRKPALFLLGLVPACLIAQQSTLLTDKDRHLREAFELFDKEKYVPAQQAFNRTAALYPDPHSEVHKTAEYYAALCAVELFHRDAEYLLTSFIHRHPESPLVKQAWFQLGKFFFRDKKYRNAKEWLRQVEPELLTEAEQDEYHFKLGYSYFKTDDHDQALREFAAIKDGDSPYATTATYYYGHIQYSNRNYESALEQFKKLANDETFGSVVPFYITQIYYLQKRYDLVISYAQPVLDSTGSKRGPEIARMIGESYYNTNRYREALPYLEQYRDKAKGQRTRDDEYQLGFVYFKLSRFPEAIACFEKAVGDQDALGQNAWYHLGWCQLQAGNKKFARNAWQQAAKADFDQDIKEQALFDYAKLAYELGYDPYDEAVLALQDYMNKYPDSPRLDEAYTFLASIYTTTRNYRTALQSLDRIKKKTDALKTAYQRVAFFWGIELLNSKNYPEAIRHFDLSLQYPSNKELAGQAHYWKAEANYRSGNYAGAVKGFQEFVYSLNSFNQKNYNRVNYNIGYAYYKQKDYANAITWFRKYVAASAPDEVRIANDALVRLGDCYFVSKQWVLAIEQYDKAIDLKGAESDYALYQKALAQGVTGRQEAKIATLGRIATEYPASKYLDKAKFETGKSYQNLGRNEEAYATYNGILLNHANSDLAGSAMVQMALIRYNQDRDEDAASLYNRVIDTYPGSEDAKEAYLGLRRVREDKGEIVKFDEEMRQRGLKGVERTEADSSTWEFTEKVYQEKGCEKGLAALTNYLNEFPDGIFSLQALGYKAECEMRAKQVDAAAKTYGLILQRPQNQYTAEALLVLGIYEREKDNYPKALEHFKALETAARNADQTLQARTNIMRLSLKLDKKQEAYSYAQRILSADKANEELKQEARLIIARHLLAEGNYDKALDEFQKLRKLNSETGAEARYSIAFIYHQKGEYSRCEKALFELIDEMGSYDYWLAKGFILLADNYVKLGNEFQARRTLQSVIDNHEGEQLRTIAKRKLESLDIREKQPEQEPEKEKEIQFRNNGNDDRIFDNIPEGGNRE